MNERGVDMDAEKILNILEGNHFERWYGEYGPFDKYILGSDDAPSREEILEWIKTNFNCNGIK